MFLGNSRLTEYVRNIFLIFGKPPKCPPKNFQAFMVTLLLWDLNF